MADVKTETLAPGSITSRRGNDLEIKDAQLIFNAVWQDLEKRYGRQKLHFPREMIWLGGAPGAGKGTNTPFIAKTRGITADPVVVSSLLQSPAAEALKNAGRMVGDREVIGLLFDHLLDPIFHDGVIVDGFPRTKVQVECLKLLYHRMLELHHEYRHTPQARQYRQPLFRIVLLFVSEEVSVKRQLYRGQQIRSHNKHVRETGVGEFLEERVTDLDPELCRNRYRTFKETTFEALQSLRAIFHFHFVDAESGLDQVQENILREFGYQSSLELSPDTLSIITHIPVAAQLSTHARQELVERLDTYADENPDLLRRVVALIDQKFLPIIRHHAISGAARINTEDPILQDVVALRMLIDVFSERGYHVTVDIHKMDVPERVNLQTGEITCRQKRVYRISVTFPKSEIRRGV